MRWCLGLWRKPKNLKAKITDEDLRKCIASLEAEVEDLMERLAEARADARREFRREVMALRDENFYLRNRLKAFVVVVEKKPNQYD